MWRDVSVTLFVATLQAGINTEKYTPWFDQRQWFDLSEPRFSRL